MNKPVDIPYLHSIEPVLRDDTKGTVILIKLIFPGEDFAQGVPELYKRQFEQSGFSGKDKQVCILRDNNGGIVEIVASVTKPLGLYAFSHVFEKLRAEIAADFLKNSVFKITTELDEKDALYAAIGWALASYRFDLFKKDKQSVALPALLWPEKADRKRAAAMVQSLCLIKTLINIPANIMGTDQLAHAAEYIANLSGATCSRIVDQNLLKNNFPMIYDVGKASPQRPQLVEINWGKDEHPHLTLVGKGIVFDTGGLDIKPPPFMALMKIDMGGAAHALAVGHVIMALNLPIRLRILIAAAENSISGESFRPGDVLKSRKGLSVEVGDTDAEGRLVIADALTYACEAKRKADLIVDFSTLTGSARAALGYDIPAIFSNRDSLADELKNIGMKNEDPLWPLPLYQPYLKEMNSSVADINNIGSGKAGAIHGALFLQQFIDNSIDWIHVDCYAWEQSGKAGRPAGGADTGMRAVLILIEKKLTA